MSALPRTRTATQRLMRGAAFVGRRDIEALYLRAFGITDLSGKTLPAIFDKEHTDLWHAYIRANDELHGTPARSALRAVLSFVEYASASKIKLTLGKQFRDPLTARTVLDTRKIRHALVVYELESALRLLKTFFVRMNFMRHFRVYKSKTTVARVHGAQRVVATYAFTVSEPRTSLDALLRTTLDGTLYRGILPLALTPTVKTIGKTRKDVRPRYDTLMVGPTVYGWHPIERNSEFDAYLVRAKDDILVLKVILAPREISETNNDLPLAHRAKVWSKFKLT